MIKLMFHWMKDTAELSWLQRNIILSTIPQGKMELLQPPCSGFIEASVQLR